MGQELIFNGSLLTGPDLSIVFAMSLESCAHIADADCDVVVFINDTIRSLGSDFPSIEKALTKFEEACVL